MAREPAEPAPKKSNTLLFAILGGVLLAGVLFCCCLPGGGYFYWDYSAKKTAEERQKKVDDEPGLAVTADELSIAYVDNPIAADAKFKDKVLVVQGRVLKVDTATNRVNLQPGVPPGKITIGFVECNFADKNKGQLSALKGNDNVKIKGYCTGQGFLAVGSLSFCKKVD